MTLTIDQAAQLAKRLSVLLEQEYELIQVYRLEGRPELFESDKTELASLTAYRQAIEDCLGREIIWALNPWFAALSERRALIDDGAYDTWVWEAGNKATAALMEALTEERCARAPGILPGQELVVLDEQTWVIGDEPMNEGEDLPF